MVHSVVRFYSARIKAPEAGSRKQEVGSRERGPRSEQQGAGTQSSVIQGCLLHAA